MNVYQNLFNETSFNVDQVSTNRILVQDGSASSPSISFILDPTTGFYRSANGEVSYTSGGKQVFLVNGNTAFTPNNFQINGSLMLGTNFIFVNPTTNAQLGGIYCDYIGDMFIYTGNFHLTAFINYSGVWQFSNQLQNSDGSVTNPMNSITNETDLGMYRSGASTLSFCSNSVDALDITNTRVTANVQLLVPAGSYTTPSIIFNSSEATTGIYREGVNTLSINCNGDEVIRFGPTQLQIFEPLAMGTNTINCGNVTLTGVTWTGSSTCCLC
jgi:hypothetical protein